MKQLSSYGHRSVTTRLWTHPERAVTPLQIAEHSGACFIPAATMTTTVNSLRKINIWPLGPNVYTDDDFLLAETTSIPADS